MRKRAAGGSVGLILCVLVGHLNAATDANDLKLPTWAIGPFVRPATVGPIIRPDRDALFTCPMTQSPVRWEALHTFNPAAVVKDGKVVLLYRAEDDSGVMTIGMHTSRLGLGISEDGLKFDRQSKPCFFPDDDEQKTYEWDGGCEDPRLIAIDGSRYLMTYTQWNHKTPHLATATTTDFVHWQKHGPAFAHGDQGRYLSVPSKSGAVIGKLIDDQLVAVKINGKYWMYWGDLDVYLASSPDLIDWSPVETAPGKLLVVLPHRPGKFDSALAESGPPAVLTDRGIVLVYNGKNSEKFGDPHLQPGAYSVGQALMDPQDPSKILDRLSDPFFQPKMPFEKIGQYAAGTTFSEGLIRYHGKWFMYYGCADSLVGVAVSQ